MAWQAKKGYLRFRKSLRTKEKILKEKWQKELDKEKPKYLDDL